MKQIIKFLIWLYQHSLGLILPNSCRFQPTCSEYAKSAVEIHGALKGSWLAIKRIGRCHPYSEGGYDPVPHKRNEK